MRDIGASAFNDPSREYDYSNEVNFRFSVDREIGSLRSIVDNLQNASGSQISKGIFRQNTPFFRASIVDY